MYHHIEVYGWLCKDLVRLQKKEMKSEMTTHAGVRDDFFG